MSEITRGDQRRLSLMRTRWQTVRFYLTSPVLEVAAAVALAAGVVVPVMATPDSPDAPQTDNAVAQVVPASSPATDTAAPSTTADTSTPRSDVTTTDGSAAAPEIVVTLVIGSLVLDVTVRPDTTVGELLDERGVSLGADDTVSPPVGRVLADGDRVVVTQIRIETSTADVVLPQPESRTVFDDTLAKGASAIAQQGRPGVERVTYRTKVTDGVPGEREVVSRRTVTEPLATITKVGTKVVSQSSKAAPPPTVAPTTSSAPSTPVSVAQEQVVRIACDTAATVQVTVTGPAAVALALDPGGSWKGDRKVTGSATLPGPGSVTATFTGTYYSVSALGGVCR